MTKIAIYGAGAIGGYMGAMLAKSGADVSLIARGPHLAAMKDNGLTLIKDGARDTYAVTATDDPSSLGVQDFVIVTLKAHSISAVTDAMQPLLGPDTAVVFAVNGVPWWYFHQHGGPLDGTRLATVDPGNRIWDAIGPERAIGCVVYPATEVEEPGVIRHISGDRFSLGEPSGEVSERCQALSALLKAAGLKAPVRPRIRDEIWVKLWGNCSLNPISALTGATLEDMCRDDATRGILRNVMLEAQAAAEATGIKFSIDVDKRIAGAEAVGAHKTSMLQDLELRRPMEIDALVSAVTEIAAHANIETPTLSTILGLVQRRAYEAGCYRYPDH
ncbi:MAG: 2-dehydropantoate 2-reductase [Alphaproteobacteria bacterium]|nr:2-dehydropantoate 2-reductase [Alphaproteobacteria bacterium]